MLTRAEIIHSVATIALFKNTNECSYTGIIKLIADFHPDTCWVVCVFSAVGCSEKSIKSIFLIENIHSTTKTKSNEKGWCTFDGVHMPTAYHLHV